MRGVLHDGDLAVRPREDEELAVPVGGVRVVVVEGVHYFLERGVVCFAQEEDGVAAPVEGGFFVWEHLVGYSFGRNTSSGELGYALDRNTGIRTHCATPPDDLEGDADQRMSEPRPQPRILDPSLSLIDTPVRLNIDTTSVSALQQDKHHSQV